jgi:hypothetical protein
MPRPAARAVAAAWPRQELTHAGRVAQGKGARLLAPLESHAEFAPDKSRVPAGLLFEQAKSRVPDLVPIRNGRMLVSPFTYYRGAALPMAADLATTPTSGLRVQLCGDAHPSNFGGFASPSRRLVFDVNDFDETLPGPFEWDVKRLAASLAVAGRDNGFGGKDRRQIVLAAAVPAGQGGPAVRAGRLLGRSQYRNQGERVVAGQLLMQAESDIFLGWTHATGPDGVDRDFYVRQLKDWKLAVPIEQMVPAGMKAYARMCGWTLARAHARSGDRVALAAYLGGSDRRWPIPEQRR